MQAQNSYRKYIDEWSCLRQSLRTYRPEVCGVDWWQGVDREIVGGHVKRGRQIRMHWVRQIYGSRIYGQEGEKAITPEDVFALEVCPYHSRAFVDNGILANRTLVDFMRNHVIMPALMATWENELPFAIAIGGKIASLLEGLKANKLAEWSCENPCGGWPKKGNTYTQRYYRLYSMRLDEKNTDVCILVTWGARNRAPSKMFENVESLIREYRDKLSL